MLDYLVDFYLIVYWPHHLIDWLSDALSSQFFSLDSAFRTRLILWFWYVLWDLVEFHCVILDFAAKWFGFLRIHLIHEIYRERVWVLCWMVDWLILLPKCLRFYYHYFSVLSLGVLKYVLFRNSELFLDFIMKLGWLCLPEYSNKSASVTCRSVLYLTVRWIDWLTPHFSFQLPSSIFPFTHSFKRLRISQFNYLVVKWKIFSPHRCRIKVVPSVMSFPVFIYWEFCVTVETPGALSFTSTNSIILAQLGTLIILEGLNSVWLTIFSSFFKKK